MIANKSLHIHVETYIFEVSRIDDKALTMTFELYMDFMWEETRKALIQFLLKTGPSKKIIMTTYWLVKYKVLPRYSFPFIQVSPFESSIKMK